MLILNQKTVYEDGEVTYCMSRQVGGNIFQIGFRCTAESSAMSFPRRSPERSRLARIIVKKRAELQAAMRGARG